MIDIDNLPDAREITQKVGIEFDSEGEPTAGFIIVGFNSPQYREAVRASTVSNIQRQATKGGRVDAKTEEGAAKAFDHQVAQEENIAVAVTVGWFGFTSKGEPVEFSSERVRAMFRARPTWRERVTMALGNEQGFLPNSAKSSESSLATTSA